MRQQAYINQEKSENQNSSLYFGKYDSVHIVNNMGFYMLTKSRDFHQMCSSLILHAFASPREINPQYDIDGNMIRYGDWTYAYDSGNRLVSVSSNDTLVVTLAYDSQGRRVKKVAADGTHRYFYDGWLLVYEHITRSDNTISEVEYVWGKDISGTRDGAAGIGGLLYQKSDGAIYVPWYDAYGNILGYCDAQGNTVAFYTYDAFGNIISQSGSLADLFRHRFSTKYFDAETGLYYYYGYRFYHPIFMRWLNRDPIGENGGVNLYGFCRNSSICFSDTLGKTIILTMDYNPDRKDVIKYKGKESRARGVTRRYEKFHAKASVHSSSFDSNNRNQGGQYAKYPFDTSTFKWE